MAWSTTTHPRDAALLTPNLEERAASVRQGDSAGVVAGASPAAAAPAHRTSPLQRTLRVLRRPPRGATFVVWCGAVALLFKLAAFEGQGLHVPGYVQARSYEVAPLASGRVGAVVAQLQQHVEAGQVLVTLDSQDTELALQAASAELARVRAERAKAAAALEAAKAERAAAHSAELRRFTTDRDTARIQMLQVEAQIAEDSSRLERLEVELAQLGELGTELIAPDKLQDKRLQRDTLVTRIQAHRGLLGEQELLFQKARQRADEFAAKSQPTAELAVEMAPFDQAITAQQARIEQLRLAQRELVLRAPISGRVAAIARGPGEVVSAGEVVLTVVEREPSAVVAHVPEEFLPRIALGTEAVIYRHGNRAEAYDAVVVHTGFEVERMPRRADVSSAVPRWGFPVHLSCPTGRGIVAGEQFTVQFRTPETAPTPPPP